MSHGCSGPCLTHFVSTFEVLALGSVVILFTQQRVYCRRFSRYVIVALQIDYRSIAFVCLAIARLPNFVWKFDCRTAQELGITCSISTFEGAEYETRRQAAKAVLKTAAELNGTLPREGRLCGDSYAYRPKFTESRLSGSHT